MPCISYESDWANHTSYKRNHEVQILKAEADRLARIACQAISEIEKMDSDADILHKDSELTRWWAAHKQADAARMAKEQKEKDKKAEQARLRKAAMAKLTDEERAAFGLR